MVIDPGPGVLVELLRAQAAGRAPSFSPGRISDPGEMLELAAKSGLIHLLAGVGSNAAQHVGGLDKAVFVAGALSAENRIRNQAFLALMDRVAEALKVAGIEAVFLKGAAFLADDPAAMDWRMLSDIDILVLPDDLGQAVDVMQRAGFEAEMGHQRFRPMDHHHYPPLYCPQSRLAVEVHHRLIWDDSRNPVPTHVVVAGRQAAENSGLSIHVPSPTHRLAHLIAHAQIGDRNQGAAQINLKDMLDLFKLCEKHAINWDEIASRFKASQAMTEYESFMAATALIFEGDRPNIPRVNSGQLWARRAVQNLEQPWRGRRSLFLHVIADYARQLVRNPAKLGLAAKTLFNASRRRSFFGNHIRRWRR